MEGTSVLVNRLAEILGIAPGETTRDKEFSIEYCECLGQCATAPGMLINDEVFGGVEARKLESILERFRDKED
jgi:NADH:ubiquinone oxidoreductase subunit E